jgi:hypothetical protein
MVYDSYFEIKREQEGLFLKIYPAKEGGKKLEINKVTEYLENMGVVEYNLAEIKDALDESGEPVLVRISDDNAQNVDESAEISVSLDKLEAYIRFVAPIGAGKKLSREDIIQILDAKGIIYGIDFATLENIVVNREPNREYFIAKGQPVILGKNAEIKYNFSSNLDAKPKVNDDGSVDFHQLNLINNVKKGDLLAELIPEEEGIPGMDVFGNNIKAKKVKKMILKYGKNVSLLENKLYAEKDGYVKIESDKVVVYDYYEVAGDVDSSTGDIEFDGTVIIKGNVRTGFSVKAKGDIEVLGVVEGATLISGGQVVLRRGIQGMNKGVIEAKKNLITKFIENSTVRVGGYIHSDAILHSRVTAKEEIIVDGKKGMVTGGEVRSGKEIRTKVLGSHMGTITNVEVGIDPTIVDTLNELTNEIDNITKETKKMDQVIVLLKNKQLQTGNLGPDKIQMLQTATRNKIFLESKLSTIRKEYEELSEVLDNKNAGKIKVMNVAYPGVRVTISNVRYHLREELKYSTLYKEGADIKITSYA